MALRATHSDEDASVPAPEINNLPRVFNGADLRPQNKTTPI